ncbi:MAG: hypothetical protein DMG49_18660 [Acidobacteria bacterium]|nr:MAG: hypothetical protein DMG49_18660 [Acidobacteriota bacterium]
MKKTIAICGAFLLAAAIAAVPFKAQGKQEKQEDSSKDNQPRHTGLDEGAAKPLPNQHEHPGFMQEDMHHAVAKGVTLDAKVDAAAHTVTLSVGPMNLPAHTSHMKMPQPPDLVWEVPMDGWLLAYHPKLVDVRGNAVPGTVLHHVAFWNENRADFLCPNKEEHIFGAGSEMTDWTEVPGYGYRVMKGNKIRIETMMYNPTATSYDKAYLEVVIPFQETSEDASAATPRRNVYPAWMDVTSCGKSGYDLPTGKSEKTGTVTLKYDGVLLGVGGHLHDYGKQIVLQDVTRQETVATLDAKADAQGHLQSVPVKLFVQQGGYKFAANDVLRISATYDNPTGKLLRDGAMGIAVGYFVAADDAKMAALWRKGKPTHGMAGMSHDQ